MARLSLSRPGVWLESNRKTLALERLLRSTTSWPEEEAPPLTRGVRSSAPEGL